MSDSYDIRPVTPMDYQQIRSWGFPDLSMETVPPNGLIAPEVAAGFITFTDCYYALLHGIAHNPKSRRAARTRAILDISDGLWELARIRGYRAMLARTEDPGIAAMAEKRLGFARYTGKPLILLYKAV